MPWHHDEKSLYFRLWFLEHFAAKVVYERALAVCDAVDIHYSNLAKLHFAKHGEATFVDPRAKRALKGQLLTAMWPTWKSVVDEATGVPAQRAQSNLQRLVIENDKWLER